MVRLLFLCNKKYYDTKMSRGRFHAISAVNEYLKPAGGADIWGIGWDGYDNERPVAENISERGVKYDAVIGYMPFEMKDFSYIRMPKVVIYNEMYNEDKINSQLETVRPDIVVCHHLNEMKRYQDVYPEIMFVHIPHCADRKYYFDNGSERTTDVLVVGRLSSEHYPLRTRLSRIIEQLPDKYNCRVFRHPGYEVEADKIEENIWNYADALRTAKICITCSGKPRTRYAKYTEIPMCGAVLCADIPDQDQEYFRNYIYEINDSMSDEEIRERLIGLLESPELISEYREKGKSASSELTQEHYAAMFVGALEEFMNPRFLQRVNLQSKIRELTQFPHKERSQNYQSYYLGELYIRGTRDTRYRFDEMGIPEKMTGRSVLDLGCNLGAVCCESRVRGAENILGLEYEKDYIECARELSDFNSYGINYDWADLTDPENTIKKIRSHFSKPVDFVFVLSLYKHVKENLWKVLEGFDWKVCYLESHNAPEGLQTGHVKEMTQYLETRSDLTVEYLGQTKDRSPRCTWRLECRNPQATSEFLRRKRMSFWARLTADLFRSKPGMSHAG